MEAGPFQKVRDKPCWQSIVLQRTRILKSLANAQCNESVRETKSDSPRYRHNQCVRRDRHSAFRFCNQICLTGRQCRKKEQRFSSGLSISNLRVVSGRALAAGVTWNRRLAPCRSLDVDEPLVCFSQCRRPLIDQL